MTLSRSFPHSAEPDESKSPEHEILHDCVLRSDADGEDNVCTACAQGQSRPAVLARYTSSGGTWSMCEDQSGTNVPCSDSCSECEAGKRTGLPNSADRVCHPCEPGRSSSETGHGSDCIACDAGEGSVLTGCDVGAGCVTEADGERTSCAPCEEGSFSEEGSDCAVCPSGKYGTDDRTACIECEAGRFSASTTQTSSDACAPCAAGQMSSSPGSSACANCDSGRSQPSEGESSCIGCAVGRKASSRGSSECTACNAGRYQEAQAQQNCPACSAGQYVVESAAVACIACVPGKYLAGAGSTSDQCGVCQAGRYVVESAAAACIACGLGSWRGDGADGDASASDEESDCIACEAGTYVGTLGSVEECALCPAGRYVTSSSASSCIDCRVGTWRTESDERSGSDQESDCIGVSPPATSHSCLIATRFRHRRTERIVRVFSANLAGTSQTATRRLQALWRTVLTALRAGSTPRPPPRPARLVQPGSSSTALERTRRPTAPAASLAGISRRWRRQSASFASVESSKIQSRPPPARTAREGSTVGARV